MSEIKAGDAVISLSGVICIVIRVDHGQVYYTTSYDNFKEINSQLEDHWIRDLEIEFKPIIFTKAQRLLYDF